MHIVYTHTCANFGLNAHSPDYSIISSSKESHVHKENMFAFHKKKTQPNPVVFGCCFENYQKDLVFRGYTMPGPVWVTNISQNQKTFWDP